MKKLMAATMIVSIASVSGVLANDCNILTGGNTTIDKSIENTVNVYMQQKPYLNVLPAEAFKRALINLKSYCCTQVNFKVSCSANDIQNIKPPYPESAFLFDHLIDVAMRRLDGDKKLAYGLDPDPTALERRQKIAEIAGSANGTPANTIQGMYTGYRTLHAYPKTETYINSYNKNIATVSLGDKYDTVCEIMKQIYDTIGNTEKTVIGTNLFTSCKNMVAERVKRESGYIKILMVQKSNQLFDTTTKAYTKKYFVEERLMALWNLIAKVKDTFKTIMQQAPASKTCSK